MAESTGGLEQWRLRLPEHILKFLHRTGKRHQPADETTGLKTKSEDETSLDDKIPVLTIPRAFVPGEQQTETTDLEFIK